MNTYRLNQIYPLCGGARREGFPYDNRRKLLRERESLLPPPLRGRVGVGGIRGRRSRESRGHPDAPPTPALPRKRSSSFSSVAPPGLTTRSRTWDISPTPGSTTKTRPNQAIQTPHLAQKAGRSRKG